MIPENLSILLVDDDEDDLFLARDLLSEVKDFKAEVDVASNYEQALGLFEQNRHDIYLLDYRLGVRSGLELLEEFMPDGPVIILTGQADEGTDLRALSAGAADYLGKANLTADALARSIRYAIHRHEFQRLLGESQERLNLALRSSGIGTWMWNLKDDIVQCDEHLLALIGQQDLDPPQALADMFVHAHPDDRDNLYSALQGCVKQSAPVDLEFRIRLPDEQFDRYISLRGNCFSDRGSTTRFAGACWDITQKRRDEELRKLLLAELDHRVKNTLQLALGIARQTIHRSGTFDAFIDSFEGRLSALSDVHSLLTSTRWHDVALLDMVDLSLRPYRQTGTSIGINGPEVTIPPNVAQLLYLALHELSTNAVKYGSLSTTEGSVRVEWHLEHRNDKDELVLKWKEIDGPPVAPPEREGFGSQLITQTLQYELGGDVKHRFEKSGVSCEIRFPLRVQDVKNNEDVTSERC